MPSLTTNDETTGLVPLHKLSQWLSYSLIEPLQWAGIEVTDIDGLTGLAEYRNGGLFIDTGVLTLRDPAAAQREHTVDSELVVEWRALTVALARPAGRCGARAIEYGSRKAAARANPARRHLDRRTQHRQAVAGGWRAAAENRQRRHGVLNRGKTMQGVTIVDHPLVQHKLTLIREKELSTKSFRELCRELGILLCYEVTRDLPLEWAEIETPMTRMKAPKIAGKKLVFAPILRAGLALVEGMLDLVPAARVAHIGLYRDPETKGAVEYYLKTPADLAARRVIVVSPVVATANTAVAAIDRLKERGASDIRVVCMIASPEGRRAAARHSSRT